MNFRTKIPLNRERNQINHSSNLLLIGSCFTENIGVKLEHFKFKNSVNPFGILFHPKAIESFLTNCINEKIYTEEDVFLHNERYHCFEAHSDLSNSSKADLLEALNSSVKSAYQQILNSTHLIITLGTAWVYRNIESDTIVANCHKVPQKKFLKELLSTDEIVTSLENINVLVKNINSTINIIYTVSPVRHLKDGFTENSLSKAHLLSAIHQIKDKRKCLYYFPSFEIMIDDLRDYRFYKSDMLHPTETAIDYIWEAFKNLWIDDKSIDLMVEIDAIQKSLAHKPFNEKSIQHLQFIEKLQLRIELLLAQHDIKF